MATDNKYDRQLRLWGGAGQKALMEASICLIGATPTGSESLKNLVLPGVDDIDCSNNFFVTRDHIGQPRASVVCELLCEMNPDVVGASLVQDPLHLLSNKPDYFDQFSLIIAADLPVTAVTALASLCGSKNIPLIVGRAYGLIGYCRHLTPLHYIIEGKPLNSQPDLRLAAPFPGLVEYASLFKEDLEGLEDNLHSHVPFVILLLIILQEWKEAHEGRAPSTQAEKDAFRAMIMDRRRDRIEVDEGDPTKFKVLEKKDEVNFLEAYRKYYYVLNEDAIDDGVQQVLGHEKTSNISKGSSDFFVVARAVKDFVDSEGVLPLSGKVPDMTATNEYYIGLQNVYTTKASEDLQWVVKRVGELLQSVGKDRSSISHEYIATFVKSSNFIGIVEFKSLQEEMDSANVEDFYELLNTTEYTVDEAGNGIEIVTANDQATPLWYIGLRAADAFYTNHGRYPGVEDSQCVADSEDLLNLAGDICDKIGIDRGAFTVNHAREMTRFGATILHNVGAFIGGIVSQEAIKILTHQYQPFNNTLIYNGITGNCGVFQL